MSNIKYTDNGSIVTFNVNINIFKYLSSLELSLNLLDSIYTTNQLTGNKEFILSTKIGILLRYLNISPTVSISGMLLSLPLSIYNYLIYSYNVDFESYASPLNSALIRNDAKIARVCSLYTQDKIIPQVVGPFNKSTLDKIKPTRLSWNPPYDAYSISGGIKTLNNYLKVHKATAFGVVPRNDGDVLSFLGLEEDVYKQPSTYIDTILEVLNSPYLISFAVLNLVFFKYQFLHTRSIQKIAKDTIFIILSNEKSIISEQYNIKDKIFAFSERLSKINKGRLYKKNINTLPTEMYYYSQKSISKKFMNNEYLLKYFNKKNINFIKQQIKENIELNTKYDTINYYDNNFLKEKL